jgi:hypothetical protein
MEAYTLSDQLAEAEDALLKAKIIFDNMHMYRGTEATRCSLAFYMANFYRQLRNFEEAKQSYQQRCGANSICQF